MPNGNLPINGYLGGGQRTTGEFQDGIDELLAYVNTLKSEVDALSSKVIKEAATRGVGTGASDVPANSDLGSASLRDVGTAAANLPDTTELNTRLATTGNLGTAAVEEYEEAVVELGGDFDVGESVKIIRVGNFVSITSDGALTHSNISSPNSAVGVIPSKFRPTGRATNMFSETFSTELASVSIVNDGLGFDGSVWVRYTDFNGSAISRATTRTTFSILYSIA